MIEYFKFIEELKNIKNDLRDLPARRLKVIDLAIEKYEKLVLSFETEIKNAESQYFDRKEKELMEEALNPLGKYKLVEDEDKEIKMPFPGEKEKEDFIEEEKRLKDRDDEVSWNK